jgi:hypothetical protein
LIPKQSLKRGEIDPSHFWIIQCPCAACVKRLSGSVQ